MRPVDRCAGDTMDILDTQLREAMERFNGRLKLDVSLQRETRGKTYVYHVHFNDGSDLFFKLDRNEFTIFDKAPNFPPDVHLNTDKETLGKLLTKQTGPMTAWMSWKLTYEGDKPAVRMLMTFLYDNAGELLRDAIDSFNISARGNATMQQKLEGRTRRIQLELDHGQVFSARLADKQIVDLHEGKIESPEIIVKSDIRTLEGLFSGAENPIKAMMLMKLRIKASMEDLAWIKSMF